MSRSKSRLRVAGRYAYAGEGGEGAFGRVLRLRDTWKDGALRAGKVVPSSEAERLRWEFERLRSVRSPFVVQALDLLAVEEALPAPFSLPAGSVVLVEAWVEGGPPLLFVGDGTDPAERVRRLVRLGEQLARGLAALHEAGLVHGDVSPANVRVERGVDGGTPRAVLLDLGTAGPSGFSSRAMGTPGFMAPEAWSGERLPQGDLFALGATLAACWRGEAGEGVSTSVRSSGGTSGSVSVALSEALRAREAWLSQAEGLPAAVREEIGRLLHPDPWRRPEMADRVAARFAAALGEREDARTRLRRMGPRSGPSRAPLLGRAEEARALARLLRHDGVVLLSGGRGSGRSRLVAEVVARRQRRLVASGKVPPTFARFDDGLPEMPPEADAVWWLEGASRRDVTVAWRRVTAARVRGVRLTAILEVSEDVARAAPASASVVRVGPLDEASFGRLADAVLGRETSPAWRRVVYEACGGLPGRFVRRLRCLHEEGADPLRVGVWLDPEGGTLLEDLPVGARVLAERLAVVGDALPLRTLPDEEPVAGLLRRGLLVLRGSEACLRADLGEELRHSMEPGRLKSRVRAVAAAASQGGSAARAFVAWASDEERADSLGEAAITWRWRQGCPEEAGRLGERLLRWARRVAPGREAVRTRLACAEAWRSAGDYERALACLGEGDEEGEAGLRRAELLRLAGRLEEAAERLAGRREPLALAMAARVQFDRGQWEDARQMARRVVRAAGAGKSSESLSRAHEVLALLASARGELAEARREAEASLRAAGRVSEAACARAEGMLATVAMRSGDARGFDALARAADRAERLGERHLAAGFRVNAALGWLSRGELGRALRGLEAGARSLASMGRGAELGRALLALGSARMLVGDLEGAREAFDTLESLQVRADPDLRLLTTVARLEWNVAEVLPSPDAVQPLPFGWRRAFRLADRASEAARALALGRLASLAGRAGWRRGWRGLRVRWESLPASARQGGAGADWLLGRAWEALGRGALREAEDRVAEAREVLRGEGGDLAERRWQIAVCAAWLAEARGEVPARAWEEARRWVEMVGAGLAPADRLRMRAVPLVARALRRGEVREVPPGEDAARGWERAARAMHEMAGRSVSRRKESLLRAALEIAGGERAALLERDDSGAWCPLLARRADGTPLDVGRFVVSTTLLGRAWRRGEPLVAVDAGADESLRGSGSVHRAALRSVLVVPMPRWGAAGGALLLDDRLRSSAFSSGAVERVALLASAFERMQAASPTEGARKPTAAVESAEPVSFVFRSSAMGALMSMARRAARSEAPTLLVGEHGTGKERLARWIHAAGRRSEGPFVVLSCAALTPELAESRLFGHVAGAFTGAREAREGLLARASGGTLFLDGVDELPRPVQASLLRALQSGEYRPVGGLEPRHADLRVIASISADPRTALEQGRLRRDLFHRIAVLELRIPPLRERIEDLDPLLEHFLARYGEARPPALTDAARVALRAYRWPGNARELEAEVRRWVALGLVTVDVEDLPEPLRGAGGSASMEAGGLRARLEEQERRLLEEALAESGGNVSRAARRLGMSRYGLQKAMRRLGVRR